MVNIFFVIIKLSSEGDEMDMNEFCTSLLALGNKTVNWLYGLGSTGIIVLLCNYVLNRFNLNIFDYLADILGKKVLVKYKHDLDKEREKYISKLRISNDIELEKFKMLLRNVKKKEYQYYVDTFAKLVPIYYTLYDIRDFDFLFAIEEFDKSDVERIVNTYHISDKKKKEVLEAFENKANIDFNCFMIEAYKSDRIRTIKKLIRDAKQFYLEHKLYMKKEICNNIEVFFKCGENTLNYIIFGKVFPKIKYGDDVKKFIQDSSDFKKNVEKSLDELKRELDELEKRLREEIRQKED